MKYSVGNLVLLSNNHSAYIVAADEKAGLYYAADCDNCDTAVTFSDKDILMLIS